jgi:uncharacterized protein (UPF0332 family)
MSVTYSDFYNFAANLAAGANEIEWRNSASRAYYAAFHRAQETVDLCPDNAHLKMGSHERVTDRFDLHKSVPAKSISYVLQSMKRIRHCADYEIADEFAQSLAVNQVAQYVALVSRLDAFDSTFQAKKA